MKRLFLVLGVSSYVFAARDPFKQIEETQRLLELRKQQEYINKQLEYPDKATTVQEKEEKIDIPEGEKYKFNTIEVLTPDGKPVRKRAIKKIVSKYLTEELGKKEIYELLSELSNYYLKKGYMTTLVTIKSGNVKKGELIYEVKEGRLRDINYLDRKKTALENLKIGMAFPTSKGKLLTTQDMDQGLENMNIGGNNNVTEVTPTEEYGYSDIIIEESYRATGFGMGIDNSGTEDKGVAKLNVNFSQDNILGINDNLSLNYIERLSKNREEDKESNYDIGYSLSLGYWNLSYGYNLGDNVNTTKSDLGAYVSKSKSEKHKFKLKRVLYRSKVTKTTFNTELILKNNYNSFNGITLSVNTKKYTTFKVGIDHTTKLFGGTTFGMIEYERGVPWFGGQGDPKVLPPGAYKNEYNKINFSLDWRRMFSIVTQQFQYGLKIGGAYSDDRLLSANQFTMGDEYTVRGFKESSVAGNKGIYMNNTLSYMWSEDMNRFVKMFTPFIGFDMGVSRDMDLPTSDFIMGMAIGLKFYIYGLSGSITYGIPLKWADGMPKEDNPVYLNFSYNM